MNNDPIKYDEHGNFLLDGELEVQWMKLHREIQSEYRQEQALSVLKGLVGVTAVLSAVFLLLNTIPGLG